MKNKKIYKERILKVLRDFGEIPTARISAICGINYYSIIPLLEELRQEGKIISNVSPVASYWRLK